MKNFYNAFCNLASFKKEKKDNIFLQEKEKGCIIETQTEEELLENIIEKNTDEYFS